MPALLTQGENETLFDDSAMNACLEFSEGSLDLNNSLLMTPMTTISNAGDQIAPAPPVIKNFPSLDFQSLFPISDVLHSELYVVKRYMRG